MYVEWLYLEGMYVEWMLLERMVVERKREDPHGQFGSTSGFCGPRDALSHVVCT